MGTPVLSASWYMVEHLRPRLRSHADIRRHVYRGEPWYVLEDPSAERYHRFSPEAYQVLVLLDGQRTMHEVWEQSCGLLGTEAPTQEQLIQLLAQMAQADVLHCDVPPDAAELIERQQRARNTEWKQQWLSPLFWKVRLFDPQPVVERLEHIVAPLFTRSAAVVWLLVVGLGAITAAQHWAELSEGVVDRVLSGGNLVVLSLLFPVLKTCHEFAHAFAVRRYGGEVHDMGVLFLVFMPLPFVDASAASGFKERRHRMVVGAAGILCELFIAACAMFVWVEAQPGLVRVIAFNTLFISGASTLLFNGNPLLRYDGY
ncbi:MAG: hypothetical protein QF599_07380, partial [Planctomycetota bacterium]|nr:hypothetical protein [Planctomycetota bacterium]